MLCKVLVVLYLCSLIYCEGEFPPSLRIPERYGLNFRSFKPLANPLDIRSWIKNFKRELESNLFGVTDLDGPDVEINGRRQRLALTNHNADNVHTGVYKYFDGELIKFSCRNQNPQSTWISINSNAYKILGNDSYIATKPKQTGIQQIVSIYLKLTEESNNKFVRCTWDTGNGSRSILFVAEMWFKHNETVRKNSGFLVKGLQVNYITPCPEGDPRLKICFQYDSYLDEYKYVNVIPLLNGTTSSKACTENSSNLGPSTYNNQQTAWPSQFEPIPIRCDIMELHFAPNLAAYGTLFVKGLTMVKTSAMYFRVPHALIILYEYYDNEQLHLQCISTTKCPKWISDHENGDECNSTPVGKNFFYIRQATFTLNASVHSSILVCQSKDTDAATITIILKRKQASGMTDAWNSKTKGLSKTVIGAIIAFIVVIVLTVIIVVYIIFKHKRKQKSPALLHNETESSRDIRGSHNAVHFAVPDDEITYVSTKPSQENRETNLNNGKKHDAVEENEETMGDATENSKEIPDILPKQSVGDIPRQNDGVTYAELVLQPSRKPIPPSGTEECPYAQIGQMHT